MNFSSLTQEVWKLSLTWRNWIDHSQEFVQV